MNVVIDTNIVLSAVLKDRDPEAIIRFVIGHPHYTWVASPAILTENAQNDNLFSDTIQTARHRYRTTLESVDTHVAALLGRSHGFALRPNAAQLTSEEAEHGVPVDRLRRARSLAF